MGLHKSVRFYLFLKDEEGNPTKIPYDKAGYMDIAPLDKCENVRREISLTIESMGLTPVRSHHERGPGQNKIDFYQQYRSYQVLCEQTKSPIKRLILFIRMRLIKQKYNSSLSHMSIVK